MKTPHFISRKQQENGSLVAAQARRNFWSHNQILKLKILSFATRMVVGFQRWHLS
jgi:hypothetical protein